VKFTYDDYRQLPDDGKRYEIIDEDLCVSLPPPTKHQVIVGNLLFALSTFAKSHTSGKVVHGPLEVYFSNTNMAQPDLIFISNKNSRILKPTKIRGAPDLVIEVVSPGTEKRDRTSKRKMYAQFGVREYWIAKDKTVTVEIFRLQERRLVLVARLEEKDVLTSPLFPGLEIPLAQIFDFKFLSF
jgi:Uma2 family endonuclease